MVIKLEVIYAIVNWRGCGGRFIYSGCIKIQDSLRKGKENMNLNKMKK